MFRTHRPGWAQALLPLQHLCEVLRCAGDSAGDLGAAPIVRRQLRWPGRWTDGQTVAPIEASEGIPHGHCRVGAGFVNDGADPVVRVGVDRQFDAQARGGAPHFRPPRHCTKDRERRNLHHFSRGTLAA